MRNFIFAFALFVFALGASSQQSATSSSVVISIPDGSATFRPDTQQARILFNANLADLITIRGRTNSIIPSEKEESLSLAQVLSARTYLIDQGVSPQKINVNYASTTDLIAEASQKKIYSVEVELIFVTKPEASDVGLPLEKKREAKKLMIRSSLKTKELITNDNSLVVIKPLKKGNT